MVFMLHWLCIVIVIWCLIIIGIVKIQWGFFFQGTKNTLAMYLNMSEINEPLSMDENSFQRMRNLKLLHFYKPWWWSRETGKGRLTLPNRGLHHFPRKLRLLRWDEYPSKCMPFNFRAESLVEIRMEYSKLEKLWEGTQVLLLTRSISIPFKKTIKAIFVLVYGCSIFFFLRSDWM